MKNFPTIKFGMVVTLMICALIVAFPLEIVAGVALGIMFTRGEALQCPLRNALNSLAFESWKARRLTEIATGARLIEHDPSGLELYEFGSQRAWAPAGSGFSIAVTLAEQERGIYVHDGIGAKPGDVVLDVGANIGLYARQALKQGAAKIIAIEPAPDNLMCLHRNLKDEILSGKVIVCSKGAWDRDDVLNMNVNLGSSALDSLILKFEAGATIKVPVTTIDTLVKELNLERVDFIKMDIEGAERQALAGAANTIRKFRPRMAICVYHLPDDPLVIPAVIGSAYGYYRQECGPCLFNKGFIKPEVYFYY